MTTPENTNKLENNEVPKVVPENLEQKEISQEEFLNWLDNEDNNFKQETQQELDKVNSIDLDQPTFEKIKNETGVENDLNAVDKEAEQVVDEAKLSLDKKDTLHKEPTSLEEVFNSDSDRVAELRALAKRTPEQESELLTDRIGKLIQFHKHMIENRQNFSGKEIDEVEKMLVDFQMQRKEVLGEMAINPKQEQLSVLQKKLDSYNAQNKEAFENPDKYAFMNTDHLEQEIAKLTAEISEIKDKTEYKYISEISNQDSNFASEQIIPTENTTSLEKNNFSENLKNLKTFDELYAELDKIEGIQGSQKFYTSKDLKKGVQLVMEEKIDSSFITNTYGLRDKVTELKNKQRESEYYESLGIKKLSKEELYADRIKHAVDMRDLISRIITQGDITAPDGYVYKKDDMITIITNLKDINDPNLQKITNTHGLRDKVKELIVKRGQEDV